LKQALRIPIDHTHHAIRNHRRREFERLERFYQERSREDSFNRELFENPQVQNPTALR